MIGWETFGRDLNFWCCFQKLDSDWMTHVHLKICGETFYSTQKETD